MNIKDIMSSNLITCDKDATLNDVSIKMKNYDIGFIPISDEKKIIGQPARSRDDADHGPGSVCLRN